MKKAAPVETIFKFLSAIFFLLILDVFLLHPLPNLIAAVLLLIVFFYMGRPSEKA